jgi:hypothetical protein
MNINEIGPCTDIQAVLNHLVQNISFLGYEQGLEVISRRPTIFDDLDELKQRFIDNKKELRLIKKTRSWLQRSSVLSKVTQNPAEVENIPVDLVAPEDDVTLNFLSLIVRNNPGIFNFFRSRNNPVRGYLMRTLEDLEIKKLVHDEIKNNPHYIFGFFQKELPEELVVTAVANDPGLIVKFPDFSFEISDDIFNFYEENYFEFLEELVKSHPDIFKDFDCEETPIRSGLLRTFNNPDVHKSVLAEVLRDPFYIFNFCQHEIPEDWIAQAIKNDPSVLSEFVEYSFVITEGLSEIFKLNGLYAKHIPDSDYPYLAFKNAIDENIYAILYAPDDVVTRYFKESFQAERQ